MRHFWVDCIFVVFVLTSGCSDGGIDRHDLHGNVTFKGQPVPYGMISFRPDRKKGGSGPSGFAIIDSGAYDTSGTGKGAVSGPVEVMIEGAVSKQPMAEELFPIYRTTIEVDEGSAEFDFEVPESTTQNKRRR
ncbi:MAG: hypothetical protein RH917_17230 [Lacipirellulaceae bacterium]